MKSKMKQQWYDLYEKPLQEAELTAKEINLAYKIDRLLAESTIAECITAIAISVRHIANQINDSDEGQKIGEWFISDVIEAFMPQLATIEPDELLKIAQEAMNEQLH